MRRHVRFLAKRRKPHWGERADMLYHPDSTARSRLRRPGAGSTEQVLQDSVAAQVHVTGMHANQFEGYIDIYPR